MEVKLKTFSPDLQGKAVFVVVNACTSKDYLNNIVGVCFVGQDVTGEKIVMDKFITLQGDYRAIVHSPNPLIPPIFAADENTCCLEWNTAMERLTGWSRGEVIGKMLVGEVFGSCCRLRGLDALTKFMIVLHNAVGGQETEKFPLLFFDRNGKFVQAMVTANKRVSLEGKVVGAFCFLQIPCLEALAVQTRQDAECLTKEKELAYICQVIKSPLSGLRFTNSLLEGTELNENQKQFLETSVSCEKQISRIVTDMDLERLENGLV